MTVCIGVISTPMVIVASDRMITSEDVEFEQPQPKIFSLAPRILALISGDIATQTELVNATIAAVQARSLKTVRDVTEAYADAYAAYCQRKAAAAVLKPLGVGSVNELLTQKDKWPASVVSAILDEVTRAAFDDECATIIAGVDDSGPHLSIVERPGTFSIHDRIGFVSVGAGQRHAESQFMLAGYVPSTPFPAALYLTYVAKKRSEVAPGVGAYTDLAVITAGPQGSVIQLDTDPQFSKLLQDVYQSESNHVVETRKVAAGHVDAGMKRIFEEAAKRAEEQRKAAQQPATPTSPPTQASAAPPTPKSPTRGRKGRKPSPA